MEDYDKMLEEAYGKLPKKVQTGERFEVPALETFVEGNKTMIKNFQFVVDKIRREPAEVSKFFTKELAVPVTQEGERLVLHRKISGEIVNKKFMEYTKEYVICGQCGKPDTHMESTGKGARVLVCEACGARRTVR